MAEVSELANIEDFKLALSSAGDVPVFVDFSAKWCAPCKKIAPKFQALSEHHSAQAKFYKVC